MTHLELRDVVKTFATATVAGSLTVPSGDRLVLLGSSGCGKTTMLRLIAGLIEPDRGDICFDGVSMLGVRPEQRGAVMAFQEHALFPYRTVGDNVGYGLRASNRAGPTSCRVGNGSGSLSLVPSSFSQSCCCSMSPSARSIESCGWNCKPRSVSCRNPPASPR